MVVNHHVPCSTGSNVAITAVVLGVCSLLAVFCYRGRTASRANLVRFSTINSQDTWDLVSLTYWEDFNNTR